jgi:hypothetical protein
MPENIPIPGTGEVHKLLNSHDDEVNSTEVSSNETNSKKTDGTIKKDTTEKSCSLVIESNDKDPHNEINDFNKDIKVFIGKNSITDDEYMTIEDLLNLGWI